MADIFQIHPHHLGQLQALSCSPASSFAFLPTPELSPSSSTSSFGSLSTPSDAHSTAADPFQLVDARSYGLENLDILPAKAVDPLPSFRRPALRVLQPAAPVSPPVQPGGTGMKRSYSLPVPTAAQIEQRRRLALEDRKVARADSIVAPASAPSMSASCPLLGAGLPTAAPRMAQAAPTRPNWGSTSTFTPSVHGKPFDFPNPHGYSQSHLAAHRPSHRSASYSQLAPSLSVPMSPPRRTLSVGDRSLLTVAGHLDLAVSDGSDTEPERDAPATQGLFGDASGVDLSCSLPSLLEPSLPAGYFSASPTTLSAPIPSTPVRRSGRVTVSPFAGYASTLPSVPGSPSAPDEGVFATMTVPTTAPSMTKTRPVLGRSRTLGAF